MSNPFVPDMTALSPGEVARSDDVNERYNNMVSGFDKLPAPAVGKKGFSDPTPVGEPTDTDHATTKNYVDTAMTSQVAQAAASAAAASTSATNAGTSETNSAASAAAALASQSAASTSETNSAASAAAASASQTAASTSETNAAASASSASISATNAGTSETNAAASAAAASSSASSASTSATNSSNSALYSQEWAVKAEDVLVSAAAGGNEIDEYSSLHYAAKSAASAALAAAILADTLTADDIGVIIQAYDVDTAKTDVAQSFSAPQRTGTTTDNDLSYDLAAIAGNDIKSTPTAAGTLTFTNIAGASGQKGAIEFTNTADYAISAAATTKISATDLARISSTGIYEIYYRCNGTNVYLVVSEDFS